MRILAWGTPLYTSTELQEELKSATVFPDVSGPQVIIVGADTLVFARDKNKLTTDTVYFVIDTPGILKGAGLPLNGCSVLPYGRYTKATLIKKAPKEPWVLPDLISGGLLERNALRVDSLFKQSKKLGVGKKGSWHKRLRDKQTAIRALRKPKKKTDD